MLSVFFSPALARMSTRMDATVVVAIPHSSAISSVVSPWEISRITVLCRLLNRTRLPSTRLRSKPALI